MHTYGYILYRIRSDNGSYIFLYVHTIIFNFFLQTTFIIIYSIIIYDTNERQRERDAVCTRARSRRGAHLHCEICYIYKVRLIVRYNIKKK